MDVTLSAALAAHQIAADAILEVNASDATPKEVAAAISPSTQAVLLRAAASGKRANWALWPALFDVGFVSVASEPETDLFLRSSRVGDIARLGGRSRGRVTMATLGQNGRFANQIFQHAYVTLYGLRMGCEVELPAWDGTDIYGQTASPPAEPLPPELRYQAFDCDDLDLWSMREPPLDANFWGYFQELPACWKPHRALLRRLYRLEQVRADAIEQRIRSLRGRSKGPLIAIHVRRGDYVRLHSDGLPWYRPAPEAWYCAWLDDLSARHPDAVLYVATDEPESVLPAFARFNPRSLADVEPVDGLSPALIDFEIMRRADQLAVCNSSFSRMAAILAEDKKSAVIVDFDLERLEPFEAWSSELFWSRFEGNGLPKQSPELGYDEEAKRQRNIGLKRQAAVGLKSYQELGSLWTAHNALSERLIQTEGDLDRTNIALQSAMTEALATAQQNHRLEEDLRSVRAQNASLDLAMRAAVLRQPHRVVHRVAFRSLFFAARVARRLLGPASGLTRSHLDPIIHALAEFRHREAINLSREAARSILQRLGSTRRVPDLPAIFATASAGLAGTPAIRETGDSAPAASTSPFAFLPPAGVDIACQIEQSSAAIVGISSDETASLSLLIAQAVLSAEPGLDAIVLGNEADAPSIVLRRDAILPTRGSRQRLTRGLNLQEWARRIEANVSNARSWRPKTSPAGDIAFDAPLWPHWSVTESAIDAGARLEAALMALPDLRVLDGRPHCLVVVPWLPMGGSEVVLLDVLGQLVKDWHLTIVTTLPTSHGMHAAFVQLTEDIVHLGELLDEERMTAVLAAVIRTRGCKTVLTSNSSLAYERAPELKARLPQVSFVSILHNDLPEGHIRHAARYAAAFHSHVAISERVRGSLLARGVRQETIRLIPNGVDTDLFSPAGDRASARAALGANESDVLLGFVGRLSGEKRPQKFLDVISRLTPHCSLKGVMVGSGNELPELEARIAAEALPVVILPKIERDQLAAVYSAFDALVMTSSVEGMPLVMLESLACETPVATTLVGDVERLIKNGENGFLAPVDRVDALADQLSAAIAAGRLGGMRKPARDSLLRSGMTREQMLDGYASLMRDTLKHPPSPDPAAP